MPLHRPHALDPATALDEPLRQALAEAASSGKPTRIAIEARLYYPERRQYLQWVDVNWKQEFGDIASGRRLVEGVDLALRALEVDHERTLRALAQIVAGGRDEQQEQPGQQAESTESRQDAPQ